MLTSAISCQQEGIAIRLLNINQKSFGALKLSKILCICRAIPHVKKRTITKRIFESLIIPNLSINLKTINGKPRK